MLAVPPALDLLLANATLYLTPALATLVLLHDQIRCQWRAPTWGRIFLGLVAMFELGRRGDFNNTYLHLLTLAWVLSFIWLVINCWLRQQPSKHYWPGLLVLICLGVGYTQSVIYLSELIQFSLVVGMSGYYWQQRKAIQQPIK